VGGLFEAGKNRVAIPERASWRNSPPKPQGKGIVGICRHELGHAFDHALGGHSHSESYLVAYNEDFKRFTNEQCRRWAYYITGISSGDANVPTSSGRAECFASVFAALVTPSNELTKQSADLLQAFPNVAKNLQNLDGELGHVPESSSSPVASRNAFGNASGNASCNASGNASGNAFGNAFRRNAFRRNASPDQSESDSHVQLAKDFLIRKEFARAADQLTFAIKLNPNNAQAFLLRGNASFWMTKHKLAIQDYSAAIRLEPANKDAYLLRSRAYGWLGERLLQEHDEAKARQLN
jgi:tetratricopeptide (TPR) repeat protein